MRVTVKNDPAPKKEMFLQQKNDCGHFCGGKQRRSLPA